MITVIFSFPLCPIQLSMSGIFNPHISPSLSVACWRTNNSFSCLLSLRIRIWTVCGSREDTNWNNKLFFSVIKHLHLFSPVEKVSLVIGRASSPHCSTSQSKETALFSSSLRVDFSLPFSWISRRRRWISADCIFRWDIAEAIRCFFISFRFTILLQPGIWHSRPFSGQWWRWRLMWLRGNSSPLQLNGHFISAFAHHFFLCSCRFSNFTSRWHSGQGKFLFGQESAWDAILSRAATYPHSSCLHCIGTFGQDW